MKWINAKDTPPDTDNYYIVRLASDEENSGDFMYLGLWYSNANANANANGSWSIDGKNLKGGWKITHYIKPDKIE
jgi:hypothetical protein